jgi:UDP-N-acetylmuramoylalanine-D-glutamate ligase
MQKFTQEQVMLYLYGEASPILKAAIDNAVKEDADFKKELLILKRSKKQLEELKGNLLSPSPKSIMATLKYAKDTARKK